MRRPQSMIQPSPQPPPLQRLYSQPQGPSMQEELKSVLDLWGAQKGKKLDIKTTPNVFISVDSTPYEIRDEIQ